jgi:hypothetical protein
MTTNDAGGSRARRVAALGIGACAALCALPLLLAAFGAGWATWVVCDLREAVLLAVLGGSGAAAAVVLSRRDGRVVCACDAAEASVPAAADAPIACDLTVFDDAGRAHHAALTRRLFADVERVVEHPNGYAFALTPSPGVADDVARWVDEERRCCPFFTFDVAPAPDGGVCLRISGPPAAKAIIRAGIGDAVAPR